MAMQNRSPLPKEYQKVECIKSTGTQYIDTGILFNHGIKITAIMAWANSTELMALFGARLGTGNNRFFLINYQGYVDFAYITDNYGVFPFAYNEIHKYTFDTTESTVFKYGVDDVIKTKNTTNFDTDTTGYIFAYHWTNDPNPRSRSQAIFKSMVIEDASGAKLFDGVPCYRKSDGEIGIYDLVNQRFLTNLGRDSFIIPA